MHFYIDQNKLVKNIRNNLVKQMGMDIFPEQYISRTEKRNTVFKSLMTFYYLKKEH